MTRHRHPALERIVRRPRPSAERFAAAAAIYGPGLMLHLAATPAAVPAASPEAREKPDRTLTVLAREP